MIRLYRQGVPVKFDVVAFGTCVSAWSRCANLYDAPEKAEAILLELLSLHEETGLVDFQPDLNLWHSMQTVWLNATDRIESMDRCAEIIQRMQKHGCQPSIFSYTNVLLAAGRQGLGDQALELLHQYALHSEVLRDVLCLNAVLEALSRESRGDSMDRATAFLEKMKCEAICAKPDTSSYTILLDALSRSEGCRHADQGRDLLEELLQRFKQKDKLCRPDATVVSVALKVCARTYGTDDDRRRALDIAVDTFRKCESRYRASPNHVVYSAMLHAMICLASSKAQPSERSESRVEVFQECQAEGHVSDAVARVMRHFGTQHCLLGLTPFGCRQVPLQDRPTVAGVRLQRKGQSRKRRRSVRMARAGL